MGQHQFEVNDEVLVFGKYEGIIHKIEDTQVVLYCPAFNLAEPWLVTAITNIVLLNYNSGLLN
jgi:hypothetical protein